MDAEEYGILQPQARGLVSRAEFDAACSSSLVGIHLAITSLRSGESDLALASGVNPNFSRTSQELAAGLGSHSSKFAASAVKTGRPSQAAPQIAMFFTGQGSQRPGMGRELYATQPMFRRELEHCDRLLRGELAKPLLDVIYPGGRDLDETAHTQPALVALEYALAQLWRSWGVVPDVVLGHSVGETWRLALPVSRPSGLAGTSKAKLSASAVGLSRSALRRSQWRE